MTWQEGICQEIRTTAAMHAHAALRAAGEGVSELTLNYWRDGSPCDVPADKPYIIVTVAWERDYR